MANEKNLKGYEFGSGARTASEEREIQSSGGIASGASRRAYKSLKQAAKAFFKENENAAMNVILALYEKACEGDVKAAEKLEDLLGETVQREELALKKKALQSQSKTNNGKAEELIAGLAALPEGGAVAEGD